MQEITAALS